MSDTKSKGKSKSKTQNKKTKSLLEPLKKEEWKSRTDIKRPLNFMNQKADIKKNANKEKVNGKIDTNEPGKRQRILTVVNQETGEVEARVNLRNRFEQGSWFVFFQKSAAYLAQNLSYNEMRVLLYMLSKVDYGNYIRVTNKNISNNLNMDRRNVSGALRSLLEKNVLAVQEIYGISRVFRVNPTFLHKGKDIYQTHKEYKELKEDELSEEEENMI